MLWRGLDGLAPSRLCVTFVAGALVLVPATAGAGSLEVSWTAPTINLDGGRITDLAAYRVYYGTSNTPCPDESYSEVSAPTASPGPNQIVRSTLKGLSAGTAYYVSVTAVDAFDNESPCLAPVQRAVAHGDFSVSPTGTVNFGAVGVGKFADRTFTLKNSSNETVSGAVSAPSGPFRVVSGSPFTLAVGATRAVTLRFTPTVAATARGNVTFTTSEGDRVSTAVVGTGATQSATTPPPATPPPATPPPATAPPTIRLTQRTTAGSHLTLTGTASSGARLTWVTWANMRGNSGAATGTTNWTAANIPIVAGKNVITVTAWDVKGHHASIVLQFVGLK